MQRRGALMSELGRGGMLATTLDLPAAAALADKHFCGIGGCNLPDQTVVAGEAQGSRRAGGRDGDAVSEQARRALEHRGRVPHLSDGQRRAGIPEVLEQTEFGASTIDTLSNYTGKLHESASNAIRSRLFFQLFNPVKWVSCMNTAIDAGVDTVIEFGGGIGKGEGPDGKRPNLETIVKKSLKWREHQAQYLPAINAATIRATAEQLLGG